MRKFVCHFLAECSGCRPEDANLSYQQELKLSRFEQGSGIKNLVVHSLGEGYLRTRLDLTWQKNRWGFWNQDRHEIVGITACSQVTDELQSFFQEFQKIRWPLEKASVRLRVSPRRDFGAWLDFANLDVKNLLAQETLLSALMDIARVEIGQKRRSLQRIENRLKLGDPILFPWISTFVGDDEIPLQSLVGGFSQTGPIAQKQISSLLEKLLLTAQSQSVTEFGSGFGALTLTAAGHDRRSVIACEIEELATWGLQESLKQQRVKTVEVFRGDFTRKEFPKSVSDTYLLNPPRSGVGNLLKEIPTAVKSVIYMSCYPESFYRDVDHLRAQGFVAKEAHLLDQFPQTPHAEWMSLWQRS